LAVHVHRSTDVLTGAKLAFAEGRAGRAPSTEGVPPPTAQDSTAEGVPPPTAQDSGSAAGVTPDAVRSVIDGIDSWESLVTEVQLCEAQATAFLRCYKGVHRAALEAAVRLLPLDGTVGGGAAGGGANGLFHCRPSASAPAVAPTPAAAPAPAASRARHTDGEREAEMRAMLETFNVDPAQTELELPSTLNTNDRRIAHKIAEELRLNHFSDGIGNERVLHISKRSTEWMRGAPSS